MFAANNTQNKHTSEIVETTLIGSRFHFLEGRISDIRAACNYPTRNANFQSFFWPIVFIVYLEFKE